MREGRRGGGREGGGRERADHIVLIGRTVHNFRAMRDHFD